MDRQAILKLYATILLVIFGGVVMHAPMSVALGTLFPAQELLIKSWKELLMIVAVIPMVWLVWREKQWSELVNDRVLQIIAAYAGVHLLLAAALLTGPTATLAGLAIDLRYILFFVLVYVLLRYQPRYRELFLKVGTIGAVIVVGFGVLQLFLPIDFLKHIGYGPDTIQPYLTVDKNYDYIRINSTMRGPNPLGAYMIIVWGLLAAALLRGRLVLGTPKRVLVAGGVLLASAVVLWVSYSRSALIGAGAAVGIVTLVTARHLFSRKVWIGACILACALLGGIALGRDHQFVTNVLLHENRAGGSAVSSNDGHVASLIDGTERMLRQPIGAGIGSTGSASLMTDRPLIIENQYLFIAHEVGWLGLGLFAALYGYILWGLWQRRSDWLGLGVFASGIGLGLVGVLLPVWADDTVAIVWWGLAAIALGAGGKYGRATSK